MSAAFRLARSARLLVAGAPMIASLAWGAPPSEVKLLPGESQIAFVSKQMGVPLEGVFRRFEAQVALDLTHPESGSIALQIDTGTASFGAPQADAELPTVHWFDVARFPRASFQSSSIRSAGVGRIDVAGKLSIKGQTRDVLVPVAITRAEGGKALAVGSFTVHRLEFRVGDGEWTDTSMVADEVQVRFRFMLSGLATP